MKCAYSKRLGSIDDRQIQEALTRFDLGRLVSARPIEVGTFGQNLYVDTNQGRFVFRGAPLSPDQFPRERFFTRKLHEETAVPVAWPYRLEEDQRLFGWPYVIMARLDGLPLAYESERERLSFDDRIQIAAAMGRTLAELHRLTWPTCGTYDATVDGIRPLDTSYASWILNQISEMLAELPRRTQADADWAKSLVDESSSALDIVFTPTFVNRDFHELNSVVEHAGGLWTITGVFDFGEAHFGDGEFDLVRAASYYHDVHPALADAFLDAYADSGALRAGHEDRFRLYMLFDCLQLWRFYSRAEPSAIEGNSFRDWAERYTSLRHGAD